ncbi:hypothetical protein [Phenylobacterium sp.]|uniref:hypothetical protein n=1 Tax=Phenylobacterium sp. TaxID=1871053 RepID=UPI0028996799|nr:hypothetical protein [Phenylobacterium sp.]
MRLLPIVLALAVASPAAAAEPAKPAPKAPAFDARDPAALVGLLAAMDAKASVVSSGEGVAVLDIVTPGGKFGAQFVDCDAKGKACGMVAFSTAFERRGPTLAQINVFNRTQVACRGYLTDDGRSNVMYGAMLTARMPAAEMRQHLGVWQGCLSTFGRFNRDPQAFSIGN